MSYLLMYIDEWIRFAMFLEWLTRNWQNNAEVNFAILNLRIFSK